MREVAIEETDGGIFKTLLELARREAGDEAEEVFEEEESVVETFGVGVLKGIEKAWDGIERNG